MKNVNIDTTTAIILVYIITILFATGWILDTTTVYKFGSMIHIFLTAFVVPLLLTIIT